MDEAKAREICKATDLSQYSRDQLAAADRWVREYAIRKFIQRTNFGKDHNKAVVKFAIDMVKFHYGSTNVDSLLTELKCYPEWM